MDQEIGDDDCLLAFVRQMVDELGSQRALADQIGISPQYLSDILSGRNKISDRFCAAIGVKKSVRYFKA